MLKEKVTNLFVLGISIILVLIAKKNFKDYFVPTVPKTPIGNGPKPLGSYPSLQPTLYHQQLWPAKPYQPKPNTPCSDRIQCPGATGICQNGICQPQQFNKTVFGIQL